MQWSQDPNLMALLHTENIPSSLHGREECDRRTWADFENNTIDVATLEDRTGTDDLTESAR
jgi:hypothetical protein